MPDTAIRLVLSDVDGTLVTSDKVLTDASVRAVQQLRDAGITFAVTSGRPPRGMAMLVEPLSLETPIAAFNGGMFVDRDMQVLTERSVPAAVVPEVLELFAQQGLDTWVYRGADWLVRNADGPHVEREAWTVKFEPTAVASFDGIVDDVVKICGVNDDRDLVARVEAQAREQFGDHVSAARSQPYYLDVTHPAANKGGVVRYLSERYNIDTGEIATIGDMPNDVLMFGPSGLGIAMGNSGPDVQRAARRVTASNDDDGFARAVERFILPAGAPAGRRP